MDSPTLMQAISLWQPWASLISWKAGQRNGRSHPAAKTRKPTVPSDG